MTRFVGRARDLAALRALVERGAHLITLVAPPGMGKTRLARELLDEQADRYDDGAYFVDLTAATTVADLVPVVASSLGLPSAADASETEARDNLERALTAKPRMLIVLDNFEHLLPDGAELVARWTPAQVIVTSRERLRISGEVVQELPPLIEAVELFIDRAKHVDPAFAPTDSDLATIAKITERLDRIPLAIELAAARTRVLSPTDLLARLADRFAILSGGLRDAPQRQATMYDAVEWSWNLLDDGERRALVTASLFRGGFTLDAFEAVLGVPGALDLVHSLHDKSLLVEIAATRRGERRLGMYESLREFATTKLELQNAGELYVRHARWATTHGQDRANLEAVVANALQLPSSEMIELAFTAVAELDSRRETLTRGQARMLDALLALDVAPETRGVTRARLARAARVSATARVEEAAREAAEVLAAAQASGDAPLAALAATRLAQAQFRAGHNADAIEHARAAIAMSRTLGDPSTEARALAIEAAALGSLDRRQEALVRFEHALSLSRGVGDQVGQLEALSGVAFSQFDRGFHAAAREHYEQTLELAHALDAKRMALVVTGYLGLLELDRERPVDALELATAATAEAREFGEVRAEGTFLAIAGAARAQLDDLAAAELAADEAERLLVHHPMFLEVTRIYRGLVDLAHSRHAAARNDLETARRYRSAARGRIAAATASKLVERSDDARLATRILKRALDRSGMSITPRPHAAQLTVGWLGAWFVVGAGERIDLSRRAQLRALLWLLAERREAQPDVAIPIDQLIATAWPEQKLLRSSALNRLHVAFATLRSLGLKDVLQRRGEGYLLTPSVALHIQG